MKTEEEYENEDATHCGFCHGKGAADRCGCWECGRIVAPLEEIDEIVHLRSIIASRDRKLREWAKRADQYDVAVGTVIKMITDELLEDHA